MYNACCRLACLNLNPSVHAVGPCQGRINAHGAVSMNQCRMIPFFLASNFSAVHSLLQVNASVGQAIRAWSGRSASHLNNRATVYDPRRKDGVCSAGRKMKLQQLPLLARAAGPGAHTARVVMSAANCRLLLMCGSK